MKREFLEGLDLGEGVKLPKSAVDAIMAEHGRDVEAKNNEISTLTTARDGLQTQLNDANATIQSYKDMDIDGIKQSAADWEQKYNTDTQKLKDDLAAANYGFAVKDAVSGMKFSSESARKTFISELTAKKLPLQDGKLLGLDDFTEKFKADDPSAFQSEEDNDPLFTRGTGGKGVSNGANAAMRAAFGLTTTDKGE